MKTFTLSTNVTKEANHEYKVKQMCIYIQIHVCVYTVNKHVLSDIHTCVFLKGIWNKQHKTEKSFY